MAKKSILSFLSSSFSGGELTSFMNLDYSKEQEDQDHTEIGKLDLPVFAGDSPGLNLGAETGVSPQIPIIGIGGAGIRLLNQMVDRVQRYGMTYPTLAVDTDNSDLDKYENISHSFHIPGSDLGSGHQYRVAATRAQDVKAEITSNIEKYITDMKLVYKHEIVFLLLGSGGTGVGAGIEIAKILIEMGKRPVPFLILPSKEEMSRIKFNAAVALYTFNYAPKDRCLNLTTICIDNDEILSKNSKKHYAQVIAASNERIASTLGDIIATTELASHAYSADLNEFLEIFRDIKGVGVMTYLHVNKPTKFIGEIVEKNISSSVSLNADPFTATRAYLYLSSAPGAISAEEYRNLMLRFDNSDIFNKLYETTNHEVEFYAIRGIFTGIDYPERIEQLMQIAEDARVEILNREIESLDQGKGNPKID
ncbi:MAG: hypothetical protein ACXAE3_01920, partial [Candidatus Kariarchaeaceae archaeon]